MRSMGWSAQQYVAFEDERTRPVRDLLAAVPNPNARVVIDLGCGPGNSTEVLASRFPDAKVSGIDSSPDMIETARRRLPGVRFSIRSIQEWEESGQDWDEGGPFDVILANAVLQWVPDHASVMPALASKLSAGGALAIQMPDNLEGHAHRLMCEVAAGGPWAQKLGAARAARTSLAALPWYYALMRPLCSRVDVWHTTYYHPLAGGSAAIVEWFKGSGLRPFLEPLDADERSGFLERCTAAIAQVYRPLADGSVLLPFPRAFIVAIR